jgi:hypothetical protein
LETLHAGDSSSFIHLLSPLTKEDVSTNNNGGGNYGGYGVTVRLKQSIPFQNKYLQDDKDHKMKYKRSL